MGFNAWRVHLCDLTNTLYRSSNAAGTAAHSWMAFMDRYLILQDDDDEKEAIKNKMLHLIDLYYDALDAPKSGKKVILCHFTYVSHPYLSLTFVPETGTNS